MPVISWYFDDILLQTTDGIQLLKNGTLTIENPTVDDAGVYKCEARNPYGKETATAQVRVDGEIFHT